MINLTLNFKYSPFIAGFLILVFLTSVSYLMFLPQPAEAIVHKKIFKPIVKAITFVIKLFTKLVSKIIAPALEALMNFINAPMRIAAQVVADEDFATRILTVAIAGVAELLLFAALVDSLQVALTAMFVDTQIVKKIDKGITEIITTLIIDFIIAEITNEVIKVIQGGGNPQFVQDWGAFSKSLADKVGGALLSQITSGYINLCQPFRPQIQLTLAPVPSFQTRVACNLSQIADNIAAFGDNFENGGWSHWIELVANPQYSMIGSYILTQDEFQKRLGKEGQAAKDEAISGKGFLGKKKCTIVDPVAAGSGNTGDDVTDNFRDADAETLEQFGVACKIVTPGDVIAGWSNKISTGLLDKLQGISANLFGIDPSADTIWAKILPFVMAIISSAMNQMITDGLSEVQKEVSQADYAQDNTAGTDAILGPIQLAVEIQANIDAAEAILAILEPVADLISEGVGAESLLTKVDKNITVLGNIKTLQENTLSNMTANLIYDSTNLRETLKTGSGTPDTTCSIPQTYKGQDNYPSETPPRTVDKSLLTPTFPPSGLPDVTDLGYAEVQRTTTTGISPVTGFSATMTSYTSFNVVQIQSAYDAGSLERNQIYNAYNIANDPATAADINNFIATAELYKQDTQNTALKNAYDAALQQLIVKISQVVSPIAAPTQPTDLKTLAADLQYLVDYGIKQKEIALDGPIAANTAQCFGLTGTSECTATSSRSLNSLVCQ